MKIFIDVKRTLGEGSFLYLSAEELADYKTKEVVGSKIRIYSDSLKEVIEIKSSQELSDVESRFRSGQIVELEDVEMSLYVYNNFPKVSIKGRILEQQASLL
jgi:hypothetical protein